MSDVQTPAPISVFTWGAKGTPDYLETPVETIPTMNLANLALQGYRHKLGNEVAAKVTAWKKSEDGKTASESQIADYARTARAEMLEKIVNGTLGVRASAGPRVSGEEAIRRTVTVEVLRKFLKAHKLVMPTGEDTITVAGKAMTREALIEAMYRKDKAKIDAEVAHRQELDSDASPEDLFAE